ncbi:hypothetical protein [Nostoc sp.]|uniref:hypothetical protein n=1 Tax=Nostoc sp. TaxID=1180 RepID=UPI002FF4BB3E
MTATNPPYKNLNLMPRSQTSDEKSGIYLDKPPLPEWKAIADKILLEGCDRLSLLYEVI